MKCARNRTAKEVHESASKTIGDVEDVHPVEVRPDDPDCDVLWSSKSVATKSAIRMVDETHGAKLAEHNCHDLDEEPDTAHSVSKREGSGTQYTEECKHLEYAVPERCAIGASAGTPMITSRAGTDDFSARESPARCVCQASTSPCVSRIS